VQNSLSIFSLCRGALRGAPCLGSQTHARPLPTPFPPQLLVGVPLMFKRLPMGEGDDAEELRYETKMYVYRLMTTPGLGLPITWNQNGEGTKLPPVLACRSDGVPFTPADWACLCEFHEYLDEKYVRGEQLWYTNKQEFKKWVGIWVR
jgi:hypothetical protein